MNNDFSEKLDQILSNPAMLAQIKALADTMTANSGSKQEDAPPPKEEPKAEPVSAPPDISIPSFFKPSSTFEKNLKNTRALLSALKPFLDERRCAKIDKMLSMMRFAEMAGQFGNFF